MDSKLKASVAAGLAAGLLVIVIGAAFLASRSNSWSGEATAVVQPASGSDAAVGYYENLNQGQLVATYAEILRSRSLDRAAAGELGLNGSDQGQVHANIAVVPATALIRVTATAPSAVVAERVADRVLGLSSAYVASLKQPYVLTGVATAGGTAKRSGTSTTTVMFVTLFVALAAGIGISQVCYQLSRLRDSQRRRSNGRSHSHPVPNSYKVSANDLPVVERR